MNGGSAGVLILLAALYFLLRFVSPDGITIAGHSLSAAAGGVAAPVTTTSAKVSSSGLPMAGGSSAA